MIREIWLVLGSLLLFLCAPTVPVEAQVPEGLRTRAYPSPDGEDGDEDRVSEVNIEPVQNGYRVETGPEVVLWRSKDTATGTYTLNARFTLIAPSRDGGYYGLILGGRRIWGSQQIYLSFLVARDGSFRVDHRAGADRTYVLSGWTPHDAIVSIDDGEPSVNDLAVQVRADRIDFLVNETAVYTAPKVGVANLTDGIWGVRISEGLAGVVIEDLEVSR